MVMSKCFPVCCDVHYLVGFFIEVEWDVGLYISPHYFADVDLLSMWKYYITLGLQIFFTTQNSGLIWD